MKSMNRLAVSLSLLAMLASSAFGRDLPNIDALFLTKPKPDLNTALEQKVGTLNRAGLPLQGQEHLGVPTFLWLDPTQLSLRPVGNGSERAEIAAARAVLSAAGSAYGLSPNDVTDAVVEGLISTGRGPVIVKFSQQVNGIPIFREELNVVMDQQLRPVAISGYISSSATSFAGGQRSFTRNEAAAAADALKDLTTVGVAPFQLISAGSRDGYDLYTVSSSAGVQLTDPIRMRKVYFHVPDGLIPAYYVETFVVFRDGVSAEGVFVGNMSIDSYSYVISAVDGSILFRKNLTEERSGPTQNALPPGGFTYRVWADPVTGIPYDTPAGNGVHPKNNPVPDGVQYPFLPTNDITLPYFPFSQGDPWIAPGATETVGNNADAYLDLFGLTDAFGNPTVDDGLSPVAAPADPPTGDFRAQITGTDQFLHTTAPDVVSTTAEARQGAIQQLFYNVNFLHDWFYDSGFNESMRNAQTNNFGRGGVGNDNVRAEVQDYSGFSNANMSTPSDGGRPRMQMYNFPNRSNVNEILAPAGIAGLRSQGAFMQGPQTFDVTADVLMATFDGANNVTNAAALAGKIAMFDFTNAYGTRLTNLTATGAAGILMVWQSGASANQVVVVTGFNTVWTKPMASISFNSAAPIKTQLAVPNTVTLRMHRFPDRDGSLDQQIVFHEWGHYLSNRLVSNSAGLSNNQGRSLGEGWGDFLAMMLTVREDDITIPSNATWGGMYALATYATSGVPFNAAANHGYYLGIRRTPYSTDMTNYNAFTFKHITNGVPLPVGPPVASGGVNAEVHNSGEVWANALWECYASLLRDTQGATPRMTFQQAQDRMKMYLVASLALTPPAPTFLEARDGVLAAAYANDNIDYLNFWAAFAKRGMGVGAVAPVRASTTHAGVVESFVVAPDVIVLPTTSLDDSVASCDTDGVLDTGEYGKLTIAVKNVGSTTLSGTTASVASTTPGVSFPNGNTVNFPASDPLATVAASITVSLSPAVAGVQQLDFQITVTDPAITGSRNGTASFRGNSDVIPASTATDNVEAATMATTPWTLDFAASLGDVAPFSILTVNPLSHLWFGPNGGAPSDNRLVSPVFTVDGSGSATMQFDHTWSFETGSFDGGVVEMQVNGGSWADVGATGAGTTNGYNGTLVATGTNPLRGQAAFVNVQAVSQHCTINRAIAPGSTVRFRFRTGADDNTAGTGWRIDNIAFSGVVETPFGTLVADTGCIVPSSTSLSPSANPSPFGSSLTLTATVTSPGGTPTGTVTFFDGTTTLGTAPLSGAGVATLTTSTLAVGLHSLTASYGGDAGHAASSSSSVAETISKMATSLGVMSSLNPSTLGDSVTFTATVSATSGTPTGSVTFLDGASPLATISLSGGVAAFTTSALTGGNHTINVTYGGTTSYLGSSSSVLQVVNTGSTVQFNPTAYWMFEDTPMVSLTVTRSGGITTGSATVQYATSPGTAIANIRYATSSGTVTFGNNVLMQTIDIPLIDTVAIEGKQTFTVTLSNPNAAVLGASVATVNIMDDDSVESDFSTPLNGGNDLLWRNETTGDTRVWEMNSTTYVSATNLLQFGGNWRLQAVADFNQDGHADLLYRNSVDHSLVIWYMNGTTLMSTAPAAGTPDPNWKIVAVGDMNRDGYPDVIWRHATAFNMAVWLMRDNVFLSAAALPTIPDANWQVKGLGDFNRDGKLDMVWRNESAFVTAVWFMDGTTRTGATQLPTAGTPWNLVGVGDMNADGDSDLIWRTSSGSNLAAWLMNQTAISSGVSIPMSSDPSVANANWQVMGPR